MTLMIQLQPFANLIFGLLGLAGIILLIIAAIAFFTSVDKRRVWNVGVLGFVCLMTNMIYSFGFTMGGLTSLINQSSQRSW